MGKPDGDKIREPLDILNPHAMATWVYSLLRSRLGPGAEMRGGVLVPVLGLRPDVAQRIALYVGWLVLVGARTFAPIERGDQTEVEWTREALRSAQDRWDEDLLLNEAAGVVFGLDDRAVQAICAMVKPPEAQT